MQFLIFLIIDYKWLVVYDNVDDERLLMPYWPEASHGKAIITTRNHNLVYKFATSGLEISSWDVQTGSDFLLFLLKNNVGHDIQEEGSSAAELAEKLSGHALGLSHMAGLIQRRSWSITEFMRVYLKDPRRLHKTELQAVWEVSFDTLEKHSRTVLGIASYLVADDIAQDLFESPDKDQLPLDLQFCTDELRYVEAPRKNLSDIGYRLSEAVEPLLTLALIKRDRDSRTFSCHRMVQTQFRFSLPAKEQQEAFDNAVALVYHTFPKQSDTMNKNQLYQQWFECNRCLQHVLCLKRHFTEERAHTKRFRATPQFCELMKDCQR
jgi:hypothetical protein